MKGASPSSIVRMSSRYDEVELVRVIHRMTPAQRAKVRDRLESLTDDSVREHGLRLMRTCYAV